MADDLTGSIWAGLTKRVDPNNEQESGRRKNWSAEQIVAKLRQIEVHLAQGKSIALACKEAEISEQSSRTSA
jgi:hypothetical protein